MLPSRFRLQGRVPFLLLIAALVVAASVFAGAMWHAFVITDPAVAPDATATSASGFADRVVSDTGSELVIATRGPGQATSCRPSSAADDSSFVGAPSRPMAGNVGDSCIESGDSLYGVDRVSVRLEGNRPASVDQPADSSISTALPQDASSFAAPDGEGREFTTRR